jgi:hypothetical protein
VANKHQFVLNNPHTIYAVPIHDLEVRACCAVSVHKFVGSLFFK